MKKKIIFFIIPILLVLINIPVFAEDLINSILNSIAILIMIGALYFFVFKVDRLHDEEKNSFLVLFLFFLLPAIELIFLYAYSFSDFLILNYLILLSIQGLIFLICRNAKNAMIIQIVILSLFFLVNEILMIVRGTPFVPVDIYSAKLGFALSGNYRFSMSANLLRAFTFMYVSIFIISKFCISKILKTTKKILNITTMIIVPITIAWVLLLNPTNHTFNSFYAEGDIYTNGMPVVFFTYLRGLNYSKPENYSREYAEEILQRYEVSSEKNNIEEMPNVIAIMSEAFSDLNMITELDVNIDSNEFFYSLEENTVRGDLLVGIVGSGTANTEFEFLTGMSKNFLPMSSSAYIQFISDKMNSLVSDFNELGYESIAIHPYWEYAWRRNDVYSCFEFKDFISAEDFLKFDGEKNDYAFMPEETEESTWKNLDTVRNYISDKENFDKVIEIYEKEKGKKFIFNITVQNHGGYKYDGENFENIVEVKNYDNYELEQYLSILKISDNAFKEFINYFEEHKDEKTIVLFFGDHIPFLENITDESIVESLPVYEKQKLHKVPFLIWANYDIEEKDVGLVGNSFLSVLLKDTAGIPLNSWDLFRKDIMEEYPAFNYVSAYNESGEIVDIEAFENEEVMKEYEILQYYFMFDANKEK